MSNHEWVYRCEAALRAAGAIPAESYSGSTHRKWRFPNGAFIQMPVRDTAGSRRRNSEALVRRYIRAHGVPVVGPTKTPGMRPSDVDTWVPIEGPCTPVQSEPPTEEPSMAEPVPTDLPTYLCTLKQCATKPRRFAKLRDFKAHQRMHDPTKPCPVCGTHYANVVQHQTLSHKPAATSRHATPPPALAPLDPAGTVSAIQALVRAADGLRGAFARLEEENKMLRRDLDKATGRLEQAKNLLGSR